ncbi:MAG TPA: CDP-alcohol phosphatidyltransferase family protein [Candidatus Dormibacteraeota bacterium]|nr:CDP-alcohol phosphatidyltransferase family protein [Candidatus Dormibacteraeota bacterium]
MSTTLELHKPAPVEFRNATRVQHALTASVERKALLWLAQRTPERVSPDHLTALGFAAQLCAGASYALARWNKYALLLVAVFIAVNWLGDSLDGTLARYRQRLRPRYGFYVDHMVDTFGAAALMTGLAASNYMHWQLAAAMLVAFLVVSIETYLAAYTLHEFRLSHSLFGPTEIRILLIAGTFVLMFHPYAHFFGREFWLFDVGGAVATVGMLGMAVIAAIRHTIQLYREERLA